MWGETPEKIKNDYETLMRGFDTSKKAAEDALKAAKERGGEMQDYKLTEDEYKHIEIYYQKILELKNLSDYITYHYNTIKDKEKEYLSLGRKWYAEFERYHDEVVLNEIYEAWYDPGDMLKRGGGKTKKKRKQGSNKSKKKRKRRRGKKSNKRRTRKYN